MKRHLQLIARFLLAVSAPAAGGRSEVSADGKLTYDGREPGWTKPSHSVELVAARLVHTGDCMPYDLPGPTRGIAATQAGPFAERGA